MQNKSIKKLRQGDREYIVTKELHDDLSISYGFRDEKGDSKMRIYTLFPGIKIIHHDVHTDKSFLGTAKKGNVIEIHHCREGRMEQPLDKGYFYLMPGGFGSGYSESRYKGICFSAETLSWNYNFHKYGCCTCIFVMFFERCKHSAC